MDSLVQVTRTAKDAYLTGHSESGGSGRLESGHVQGLTDQVGSDQEISESCTSIRLASGGFRQSRVG